MKMKLALLGVALVTGVLLLLSRPVAYVFAAAFVLAFLVYGILRSHSNKLNPLNDIPNAFRVLLACSGTVLFLGTGRDFITISAGVLLFAASILLNDEYQRRTLDSVTKRRRGGPVALLGIDGSGKSTHAEALEAWFRSRGYYCTRIAFHRYLFVDRFTTGRRKSRDSAGVRGGGNPLRPLLSAIDNLTLYVLSSFGRGIEGRVVLYDRYIWSTYVKYRALGYPVGAARWLYLLPRPRCALVLDIPEERSLNVIDSRPDHIRYRRDVLSEERSEYLAIAKRTGFPVIDASREFGHVQQEIETILSPMFPPRQKA